MSKNQMLPIVVVQPHLRFGGAENQTVLLANRLADLGRAPTIILHSKTGGLIDELDPRVRVVDLGFSSHAAIPFALFRALRELRRLPPSLLIVRLWSSIMLVGLVHNRLRQHRIAYFEDLDPRDHRNFIRFGGLKQAIIRRIFRRHQDGLVTNTEHVARAMVETYGLRRNPQVVPCAVDPNRIRELAKRAAPLPPSPPAALKVVTVGSLISRKGVIELARALGTYHRPVHWFVVGEGPLEEAIREAELAYPTLEVELVGATANPYPYIANADVMVHGARSESFGIVIIEALALGVPVAANSANGPIEISETMSDANIRLFAVDDAGSVHEALDSIERVDPNEETCLGDYDVRRLVESWSAMAAERG